MSPNFLKSGWVTKKLKKQNIPGGHFVPQVSQG